MTIKNQQEYRVSLLTKAMNPVMIRFQSEGPQSVENSPGVSGAPSQGPTSQPVASAAVPPRETWGHAIRRWCKELAIFYGVVGVLGWGSGVIRSDVQKANQPGEWVRVTHTLQVPRWFRAKNPPEQEQPKRQQIPVELPQAQK